MGGQSDATAENSGRELDQTTWRFFSGVHDVWQLGAKVKLERGSLELTVEDLERGHSTSGLLKVCFGEAAEPATGIEPATL